jgi:hypothetical protein
MEMMTTKFSSREHFLIDPARRGQWLENVELAD